LSPFPPNIFRCCCLILQGVDAPGLEHVLAAKKNADLNNKEVVIGAKSYKQSRVIEAEGKRDSMVKKAEGEKMQVISTAKGMARAVINNAEAEARSIREITRGVAHEEGNDPIRYLLSLKYLAALQEISESKGSSVIMTPHATSKLQIAQDFGLNTVVPRG
jgi:regulator of protease activity HflC (stomatin/prohibitin superfamily)